MKPTLHIFGLAIDSYTLMMVLGALLSFVLVLLINHKKKEFQLPKKDIVFLCCFVLLGASFGARFLFFITMIPTFHSVKEALRCLFVDGGLVFYGGAIGGILMGILYVKLYGLNLLKYMELILPVLPFGHALGRIGCFLSGCCYGKLVDAQHGFHFASLNEGEYALPVQLYEACFLFLLSACLITCTFLLKKKKPYLMSGLYFFCYGIWRFIIEFFRGDEIRGVYLLSTSQWISIVIIAIGAYFLFFHPEKCPFFQQQNPWIKKKEVEE